MRGGAAGVSGGAGGSVGSSAHPRRPPGSRQGTGDQSTDCVVQSQPTGTDDRFLQMSGAPVQSGQVANLGFASVSHSEESFQGHLAWPPHGQPEETDVHCGA